MQAFARAPDKISDKGPMDKNWKIFKEQFLTFMKVTEGYLEASDKQAIMLLNLMGEVGQEALQNIPFECPKEKENIQILLEKFDEYFDPPKKESNERYRFFTRTRKPNESIEDFIADLREKAKTCNFDSLADSLVRDKVILDTKDKLLRKLLLDTDDLDVMKIVTIYKSHEMATEKIKQIYKEKTKQVQDTNATAPPTTNTEGENNVINCSRCGTQHAFRQCPAWGKKCGKCQGLGHYTHKCTPNLAQKSYRPNKEPNKNVASPFTQIDKKNKTGNTRNHFRNSPKQQNTQSSGGHIPPLMAPPPYTVHPAPTEAFNPGYMQASANQSAYRPWGHSSPTNCNNSFATSQSTTEKVPLPTSSKQYASSSYSGAESAPPLDSNNILNINAARPKLISCDFSHRTSSSNVKSNKITDFRANAEIPPYGEDVANSTTINQKISPRRNMRSDGDRVTNPASIVQDLVAKTPPPVPARPVTSPTQRPQNLRSTSFSSSSSGSETRYCKSKESPDKCIIS